MRHKTKISPTQEVMLKVKIQRVRVGLTQEALAHRVGVSQSAWSHYEQGRRSISLEALLVLPVILNCSIADLLPDSIVTAVDQRRSKDMKLEEIIVGWPDIDDESKISMLRQFRIVHDGDMARTQLREMQQAAAGQNQPHPEQRE